MPLECKRDGCRCAVTMVDDNGVTDLSETRVEHYECGDGHRFQTVLS